MVDTPSRGLLVDVVEPSQAAQAQAHGALSDAVHALTVRHGNEPALSTAVRAARWRPMGDTRVLDRKGSADISPLVAVALALHELSTGTSPAPGWWVCEHRRAAEAAGWCKQGTRCPSACRHHATTSDPPPTYTTSGDVTDPTLREPHSRTSRSRS